MLNVRANFVRVGNQNRMTIDRSSSARVGSARTPLPRFNPYSTALKVIAGVKFPIREAIVTGGASGKLKSGQVVT